MFFPGHILYFLGFEKQNSCSTMQYFKEITFQTLNVLLPSIIMFYKNTIRFLILIIIKCVRNV